MALEDKKHGMSDELSRLMLSQQVQGHYQYTQEVTVEACIDNAESTFNRLLETHTGFDRAADLVNRSETIQLAQLEKLSQTNCYPKTARATEDSKGVTRC